MLIVTPGFNMEGHCEEAMALYEKAFDARVTVLLRYADADPRDWAAPLTEGQKRMIFHAEMTIGGQRVMFSDMLEFGLAKGTALFLVVTFEDAQQVMGAYRVLAEGGTVLYPPHSTTYSSCFASVVDRFGFRWGLMTEQTER